uniref:Homeodomain-only protein n=1 Tax=Arion vulgaris TaxID=1028688 RepID=A0A0B7AEQ7_9EUPU
MDASPNKTSILSGKLTGIEAYLSPSSQLPRLSDEQLKSLEENFQKNRNPSDLDITIIAAEIELKETAVRRWFEHRLARWRQQQGLPPNSVSIK